MSFKGSPGHLVQAGLFLASPLLLSIITEETLSSLKVLALGHLKIPFKQLKNNPVQSGLTESQCDYKTIKIKGWGRSR